MRQFLRFGGAGNRGYSPTRCIKMNSIVRLTREGRTNRTHVEKHSLRTRFRGSLDWHESIPRVPTDLVSIRVRDDAAAAHLAGNTQTDAKCF